MYSDICFYLDFSWENYVEDENNYIRNLHNLTRIAYLHKTQVYYSNEQLSNFTSQCKTLDANFIKSVGNQLDILLRNATPLSSGSGLYFTVHYNGIGSYILHEARPILSILQSSKKNAVISIGYDEGTVEYLRIIDNNNFDRTTVNFNKTTKTIIHSILMYGPERNFNLSDKHGENGIGEWPGESKLLCSRSKAQILLNSSIADLGQKIRLFNFDEDNDTFIEFFYEGANPQNQWHAFHLDVSLWNRVPNQIRKHFNR